MAPSFTGVVIGGQALGQALGQGQSIFDLKLFGGPGQSFCTPFLLRSSSSSSSSRSSRVAGRMQHTTYYFHTVLDKTQRESTQRVHAAE
eukprot:scaffold24105_cov113-Isochrysis_galbana.AAC.7